MSGGRSALGHPRCRHTYYVSFAARFVRDRRGDVLLSQGKTDEAAGTEARFRKAWKDAAPNADGAVSGRTPRDPT